MNKTPLIYDPIIRYQTRTNLEKLERLLRITRRGLGASLTYGQLVKTGEALEAMAERWRDLAQDCEIIEYNPERCNFCDNQFTDEEQIRCAACGRKR